MNILPAILNLIKYIIQNNNVFICSYVNTINVLKVTESSGNCTTKLVCILCYTTQTLMLLCKSLSTQINNFHSIIIIFNTAQCALCEILSFILFFFFHNY